MTTITANASLNSVPVAAPAAPKHDALMTACTEFESLVLSQMLSAMREGLPDGIIPRSQAEQMFQQMLDGEYAREISRTNSTGLATLLYEQVSQRGAQQPAADVPLPTDWGSF